MIEGDERTELDGHVSQADPVTMLEHAWGDDVLRWQLQETGSGTRLTLRHTLDDANTAAMMAAGWHMCLDVAQEFLEGSRLGPIVGADAMNYGWGELNKQYAAKLGVEAVNPPI